MSIFPDWTSCVIRLIPLTSVLGVLLNSRRVLLKKNVSCGPLGLFILGSRLNSLDSSYSSNAVQRCGDRTSWLVVRTPMIFPLDVLICTRLVRLSVGLLNSWLFFRFLSITRLCRTVFIDVAEIPLQCRSSLPVPRFI